MISAYFPKPVLTLVIINVCEANKQKNQLIFWFPLIIFLCLLAIGTCMLVIHLSFPCFVLRESS